MSNLIHNWYRLDLDLQKGPGSNLNTSIKIPCLTSCLIAIVMLLNLSPFPKYSLSKLGTVENAKRSGCADQFLLVETVTWSIVFVSDSIWCSIQFVLPIHYHQGQASQTVSQGLFLIGCGKLVDFICLYLIRSVFYTHILIRSAHPLRFAFSTMPKVFIIN